MADASVEEAGEEDITMGESATATTKAMVMITATSFKYQVESGAPVAANIESDPAQLCQVVWMDHGRAGNRSRTEGGCDMTAATTEK